MKIGDYFRKNKLVKVNDNDLVGALKSRNFTQRHINKLLRDYNVVRRGKHIIVKLNGMRG
jgi:hypothetical protein